MSYQMRSGGYQRPENTRLALARLRKENRRLSEQVRAFRFAGLHAQYGVAVANGKLLDALVKGK